MPKSIFLSRAWRFSAFCLLAVFSGTATAAQKPEVLETKHYRVHYQKKHQQLAGQALEIAEKVWPTLAKAYDAYKNYQVIDIFLEDVGDYANGNAIYTVSRVVIFVPHINWVMRGRGNWVGNVLTHELAHVFSLRRQARLSAFDEVDVGGYTYNRTINNDFFFPWIPQVAPTWWVEGIAQFESAEHGYDLWDSQRDMIVRDAYLTGTLPSLGEIETFDGDWIASERAYNTGFAFLLYLRERFGRDKVRELAEPKPFFNFGTSVEKVLGKPLRELYANWRESLSEKYAEFKSLPGDAPVEGVSGSFNQNLAFSADGRYMAWLGNGDRDYPLNWIFWKDLRNGASGRSAQSVSPGPGATEQKQNLISTPAPLSATAMWRPAHPAQQVFTAPRRNAAAREICKQPGRSEEFGSEGLEFNGNATRLLTTRSDRYSNFKDIWEYEFRSDKSESDRWHRLTWNERASYASYHPSRDLIVFVRLNEGNSNVAVLDSAGRVTQLTNFREGQQAYNPRFNPKGNTLYFTLGVADQEAIVSIPANAPGIDVFQGLRDSAVFPDSLYLAKGEKLTFVTPFMKGSVRDLRFAGDTLYWSSNAKDGVFDVYYRLRKDSVVYRATRVQGQALEPLIRNGTLYYQGYRKQGFAFYQKPMLPGEAEPYSPPADSFPVRQPKKPDYTKAIDAGEPGGAQIAWHINPYLLVGPRFLDDTTLTGNVRLGMNVMTGDIGGNVLQQFGAYVAKPTDFDSPTDYGLAYSGSLRRPALRHTRFTWSPNLQYTLSHTIAQRKLSYFDYAEDTIGTIAVRDELTTVYKLLYSDDMIAYGMDLPGNGYSLGGGSFYFSTGGRWWRRQLSLHGFQDFREDAIDTVTKVRDVFHPDPLRQQILQDANLHRHFTQQVFAGWSTQAVGKSLPQWFGGYVALEKWWATYAGDFALADTALKTSLNNDGKVAPELVPAQNDFNPWQIDIGLLGSLSHGSTKTGELGMVLSASTQVGFFAEKFPMQRNLAYVTPSNFDTVRVENPDPNLWIMTYRLGLDRMPGYGYNFVYQGRDILEGTSMFWGRLALEFPYKIRSFMDSYLPPTSLNQVQLSFIGDAGTTLLKSPDQAFEALDKGYYNLLLDFGARISATFLLYHGYPLTAYFQVFKPINELKASKLYVTDYPFVHYHRGDPNGYAGNASDPLYFALSDREFVTYGDDTRNRDDYMKAVRDLRFFFGITVGVF